MRGEAATHASRSKPEMVPVTILEQIKRAVTSVQWVKFNNVDITGFSTLKPRCSMSATFGRGALGLVGILVKEAKAISDVVV